MSVSLKDFFPGMRAKNSSTPPKKSKGKISVIFHNKNGEEIVVEFKVKNKTKRPDSALTPYQLHMRKKMAGGATFSKAAAAWPKTAGSKKKTSPKSKDSLLWGLFK
jgi:hypothetical protein